MKLSPANTLEEIAELIQAKFIGKRNHLITGINEIHQVEKGDLVFVDHPKYYEKALSSEATTILINKEVDLPEGKGIIISKDPFSDFNKLTKHFRPFEPIISKGENISIGINTIIQPNVHLGNNVSIGKDCVIHSGVTINDHCTIGDRVIIHSNTVLGSDAFYFQKKDAGYNKMHSCGSVTIKDDVEIGSLCSIDRGVSGKTIIGKGSKLDNQVHVGHDSLIGANCLFAAQVGIAGCVTIEDNVVLWGQVGVRSDVTIGNGAVVLGQSGVTKSIKGGRVYFGTPIEIAREKYKELALLRKLPELYNKIN